VVVFWSLAAKTLGSFPAHRSGKTTSLRLHRLGGSPLFISHNPILRRSFFLDDLRTLRSTLSGPWVLCRDFNLIYQAADKNNGRLSRRMMGRFRSFLIVLELLELHLHSHLFTWSNERTHPTLERIDRVFVSPDWGLLFPSSFLQATLPVASAMPPPPAF
jgi:hypothetical protein